MLIGTNLRQGLIVSDGPDEMYFKLLQVFPEYHRGYALNLTIRRTDGLEEYWNIVFYSVEHKMDNIRLIDGTAFIIAPIVDLNENPVDPERVWPYHLLERPYHVRIDYDPITKTGKVLPDED